MIPHNRPTLGRREASAANRAIKSGWVGQGPEVAAFESELADFFQLKSGGVVCVSSGTAALFLALHALQVADKTINLPVYACSGLRNAAYWAGANPTYLDCFEGTPNIGKVSNFFSNHAPLVLASIFGIPAPLPRDGSLVIEDVAQAFGAKVHGVPIGPRGIMGICSFSATKMITSGGQGGAVLTSNEELLAELRDFRQFDCRNDNKARFNFVMTDIQAAIGRVQLKRINEFLDRREQIYFAYKQSGLPFLEPQDSSEVTAARYRAVFTTKQQTSTLRFLREQGVRAIIPVQDWELLDQVGAYPVARRLASEAVSLPMYPGLKDKEVKKISACLAGLL